MQATGMNLHKVTNLEEAERLISSLSSIPDGALELVMRYAKRNVRSRLAKILIRSGCSIGEAKNNETLLNVAFANCRFTVARCLLTHNCMIKSQDLHEALSWAAPIDIIEELLNRGISPNIKKRYGDGYAMESISSVNLPMIQLFLNRGGNINNGNFLNRIINCKEYIPAYRFLLDNKADPNQIYKIDQDSYTCPLLLALEPSSTADAKTPFRVEAIPIMLIQAGARVDTDNPMLSNYQKCRAIYHAIDLNFVRVAYELLIRGCDIMHKYPLIKQNAYDFAREKNSDIFAMMVKRGKGKSFSLISLDSPITTLTFLTPTQKQQFKMLKLCTGECNEILFSIFKWM